MAPTDTANRSTRSFLMNTYQTLIALSLLATPRKSTGSERVSPKQLVLGTSSAANIASSPITPKHDLPTPKSKTKTKFTSHQLEQLEAGWPALLEIPSIEFRRQWAEENGVSVQKVTSWYYNKRMRRQRQLSQEEIKIEEEPDVYLPTLGSHQAGDSKYGPAGKENLASVVPEPETPKLATSIMSSPKAISPVFRTAKPARSYVTPKRKPKNHPGSAPALTPIPEEELATTNPSPTTIRRHTEEPRVETQPAKSHADLLAELEWYLHDKRTPQQPVVVDAFMLSDFARIEWCTLQPTYYFVQPPQVETIIKSSVSSGRLTRVTPDIFPSNCGVGTPQPCDPAKPYDLDDAELKRINENLEDINLRLDLR
ncbi:hypothetical protein FRB99_002538 [Tulasnella sp. 403]|nr:hypothetical protein FRB99_002538 [Tulasnella sp. 403]